MPERFSAILARTLLSSALLACGAALRAEPAGILSPATEPAATADAPASDADNAPGLQPSFYKTPELQSAAEDLIKNDWRSARAKANAARAAKKKSAEAWLVLGRTYMASGSYKKALRRFNKALKYDPQYAAGYYWKGKAFEARGKLDEAANEYQAAFRADAKLDAARNAWKRLSDRVASPES